MDDVINSAKEFNNKIRLILLGFKRHVTDIWASYDLVVYILIGIAISYWV